MTKWQIFDSMIAALWYMGGNYRQERSVLEVRYFNDTAVAAVIEIQTAPFSGVTARYVKPSGFLYVDLSELVRVLPSATLLISEVDAGGTVLSSQTLTYSATIWRNPAQIQHPDQLLQPLVKQNAFDGWDSVECMYIYPPSYIIAGGAQIQLFTGDYPRAKAYAYIKDGVTYNIPEGNTVITLAQNAQSLQLYTYPDAQNPDVAHPWAYIPIIPQDPCKRYGLVSWTNRFGRSNKAIFEIRGLSQSVTDTASIENAQRHYDDRKSYREEATLHLENLTAYDVWYYADIITSPSVLVNFDTGAQQYVGVKTSDLDIPNNDIGEKHTLDIDIIIGDYVAV